MFLSFFLISSTVTAKVCSICSFESSIKKSEVPPCHQEQEDERESENKKIECCPLCVMSSLDPVKSPEVAVVLIEFEVFQPGYYNSYKSRSLKPHLPPPIFSS